MREISTINDNKFFNVRPENTHANTIVITYTVSEGNIHKAMDTMYNNGTSVHYTIRKDGYLDQHHSESHQAFYAGVSSWKDKQYVNEYGIGIMLENDSKSPFTDKQIDKLIELIQDINKGNKRIMEVVGLGEIAFFRGYDDKGNPKPSHIAPGPQFPWDKLAKAGIGKFIIVPDEISHEPILSPNDEGEKVMELQTNLSKLGYTQIELTGKYDLATQNAVRVFNTRYARYGERLECWSNASEYVLKALSVGPTTAVESPQLEKAFEELEVSK